MSRIAQNLWNIIWPMSPVKSTEEAYNEFVDKINALFGDEECEIAKGQCDSYMPDAEFFRYEGIITQLYTSGDGRVDDQYAFHSGAVANLKLKQGDKVICMARKVSDEKPVEIYKIQGKKDDDWGERMAADGSGPVALATLCEWFGGRILAKINGELLVDILRIGKKIRFPINDMGCTFNPRNGDDINIQLEYGIDDTGAVDDILGFYAIRPIRTKAITGQIASFKKKLSYGIVDKEYLFYMDVLQHSDNRDNMPDKGDCIDAEVISGEYNIENEPTFHWRCIRLVKSKQQNNQNAKHRDIYALNTGYGSDDDKKSDATSGIEITHNDQLHVVLGTTNEKKMIELMVCNRSDRTREIAQVAFEHEIMSSQIGCSDFYRKIKIPPYGKHSYPLEVIGKICGDTKIKIVLTVDGRYKFWRCITVNVKKYEDEDNGVARVVRSTAYTQRVYERQANVQRGIRPVEVPRFIDNRLTNFTMPKRLFDVTLSANTYSELDTLLPDIAETLSHHRVDNYAEYFHNLLYFEEVLLRHEFRRYDQDRGHFHQEGEYLAYEMNENIFECRPSIVVGDMIKAECLIRRENNEKPTQYLGYIHKITRKKLLLKFDEEFQYRYNGEDYKLIFEFSRTKLNKLHNAVHRVGERLLRDSAELMFPTKIADQNQLQINMSLVDGNLQTNNPVRVWEWCNPKLNLIQKEAICNVLRGDARSIPYVIFGPPGTGKTSTLIEVILQLVRKSDTNLIVATPSNSSANLITKLLVESKQLECGEFVRIVSQNSLERESIPEEIHRFCLTTDIAAPRSRTDRQSQSNTGIRLQCDSSVLSTYRILVSTCSTMGSLLYMRFRRNHFTHVIIDEAGQCTEPEAAIPISLLDKSGQIILAGDPKQLGPVVLSPVAKTRGLDKSLLCRLMDRLPYMENVLCDGFDNRTVTKLLFNYRSLPSILNAYSSLFYDDHLVAKVSDVDSNEMLILKRMQTDPLFRQQYDRNYGIYFYGMRGNEERTRDSTSWRNPQETWKVLSVLTQLFQLGFKDNDIGVITPYSLQVKDLRILCDKQFENRSVKIGSVEEFQGQERNIIIISTVRSKSKNMVHDEKYGLGFIKNGRRMNVAISRARAALIIIGNPTVLGMDSCWKDIIEGCIENGTYSGTRYIPHNGME